MKDKLRKFRAVRIKEGKRQDIEEKVVREAVLRIFLNEKEIVALSCTPCDLTYLAAGFLLSEGFLGDVTEIEKVDSSEAKVVVHTREPRKVGEESRLKGVLTSGCGRGKTFASWEDIDPLEDTLIDLDLSFSSDEIHKIMSQFQQRSRLFMETAGVHGAALATGDGILLFNEDIGRHNAVDKVLGESFLKGIDLKDKFLVISGRVSSDIVSKLWNSGLSLVVSRTAPTSLAVEMAQRLGITVVGFVRGGRMNIYSYPVRIA